MDPQCETRVKGLGMGTSQNLKPFRFISDPLSPNNIEAFIIRIRVPVKGSFKGLYIRVTIGGIVV